MPDHDLLQKHGFTADFASLLKLAEILRGPGGCPWDREQTMLSLKAEVESELAEVYEAVDRDHPEDIGMELGDLLFDIAMVMQIAVEKSYLKPEVMFAATLHKFMSRHSWVFGDDKADTPEQALALWKRNKAREKAPVNP